MKILNVTNIWEHNSGNRDMDLVDFVVEYDDGVIGTASYYRVQYDRILFEQELMGKYGIPKYELEKLHDLLVRENYADHYYDED